MKAQFTIDFYIALITFVVFTTYIAFQVFSYTPPYLMEIESQKLRSEIFQISEILINDAGEPANWSNINDIKRLGLSNETLNYTNYLSTTKIHQIGICDDAKYEKVKGLLDIKNDFTLILTNVTSGDILINCTLNQTVFKKIAASISRIVAIDSGDYGELTLEVWE
jgi:hypothetical protein